MGRLSTADRQHVVLLRDNFRTVSALCRQLRQEEIHVSRQAVSSLIRKVNETGSIADRLRSGRKRNLAIVHLDFIDRCMEENNELSANDIRKKLFETFGVYLSLSSVKRVKRKLGWRYTGTRYCQQVRRVNHGGVNLGRVSDEPGLRHILK